jgi:excinuclease UvrABC nuclease subunit
LVLTERLEFSPERDAEIFAGVPAAAAVFLLRGPDAQAEPYVSKTANLRRRLQRLLGTAEERTRRLNLRDRVGAIEYAATSSDFESSFLLYKVLRACFPKTYGQRLRLRPAPLIKLHLENQYPRASVTTRLGKLDGRSLYYGPFPSRVVAEKYLNDSLDFFTMRRCVDDLRPDPAFPGCIYSEMKMCKAPCFKGCSDEEYSAEVSRVQAYFDSRGESLIAEMSRRREEASASLAFEEAAAIHQQVEKVKSVAGQLPEVVRRLDRLSALMVQPSTMANSVTFFRIEKGAIYGPATFCIQAANHTKSQSMESRVPEMLETLPPAKISAVETMEHLALLKRWFYRSRRVGELFVADEKGLLPMRRIVRGMGRVFRGEGEELGRDEPLRGLKVEEEFSGDGLSDATEIRQKADS